MHALNAQSFCEYEKKLSFAQLSMKHNGYSLPWWWLWVWVGGWPGLTIYTYGVKGICDLKRGVGAGYLSVHIIRKRKPVLGE